MKAPVVLWEAIVARTQAPSMRRPQLPKGKQGKGKSEKRISISRIQSDIQAPAARYARPLSLPPVNRMASTVLTQTRIDKWLWAARMFKTRTLATTAVDGGTVHLNGMRVKPAREVKIGDQVRISTEAGERELIVRAIGERRGSAPQLSCSTKRLPRALPAAKPLPRLISWASSRSASARAAPPSVTDARLDRWRSE